MSKAAPWIGLAALIAAVMALFWLGGDGSAARDRQLDASLIGTDGLQIWLQDQGVEVVHSNPRLTPRAADLGLRILPLYDINLYADAVPPKTPDEEMVLATQRDLEYWIFLEKLDTGKTLILLPKWRTGFVKSAVAHSTTLIPQTGLSQLAQHLGLPATLIHQQGPVMTKASIAMPGRPHHDIALFHAQLFQRAQMPERCHELAGLAEGALLITCDASSDWPAAFFLSDPDLLNNHGLGLAENGAFAREIILAMRGVAAKPVYLDTSPLQLLMTDDAPDEAQDYERGWADFARFFDYPLSVLWAVAAVILGLAGWRGALRFGPPRAATDDGLEQSKTVSIDAKARLLRLSGNDGRMVAEFVRARLDALAEASLGTGAGHDRLFKLLARRDATTAARFQTLSADLMARAPAMHQTELYQHLATFRDLLERLTHGSDPISKPD
jgi:hypothetical protein